MPRNCPSEVEAYRPTCNHCSGTGERPHTIFGVEVNGPCLDCDGSGKGPAPGACKTCDGRGQWWAKRHPDDDPDVERCEDCYGTGQAPDFDGQGIA